MSTSTPVVSDFTAGELSPFLFGQSNQPVYHKGASAIQNFVPKAMGGFYKTGDSFLRAYLHEPPGEHHSIHRQSGDSLRTGVHQPACEDLEEWRRDRKRRHRSYARGIEPLPDRRPSSSERCPFLP